MEEVGNPYRESFDTYNPFHDIDILNECREDLITRYANGKIENGVIVFIVTPKHQKRHHCSDTEEPKYISPFWIDAYKPYVKGTSYTMENLKKWHEMNMLHTIIIGHDFIHNKDVYTDIPYTNMYVLQAIHYKRAYHNAIMKFWKDYDMRGYVSKNTYLRDYLSVPFEKLYRVYDVLASLYEKYEHMTLQSSLGESTKVYTANSELLEYKKNLNYVKLYYRNNILWKVGYFHTEIGYGQTPLYEVIFENERHTFIDYCYGSDYVEYNQQIKYVKFNFIVPEKSGVITLEKYSGEERSIPMREGKVYIEEGDW
jgi:hypothetical protein